MPFELSRDAQRWLGRLPEIANLLLIVLVALSAARMFWLVWPASDAPMVAQQNGNTSVSTDDSAVDVDAIAGAHLFGKAPPENAKAKKPKVINAPETHLNLVLTGIVADSNGVRSRALIKNPQGKQDSYRVGDGIITGVKLHAIYTNKVILDRSGHYETLTLESIKKARSMKGIEKTRTVSPDLASDLGNVRRKILANPASASHYIRLQPARQNGNLVGYRIYPGADRSLFKKAGLKSGEVVTAINGQSLDNPATSLKLLSHLANASSATVTIQDHGSQRTVRVDFQ